MELLKVTGIVINSIDYKEKDKLITMFSLELGVISAVLKSVNSEKSKLKYAAMPFCFAEFVLADKNGYYTVTECSQIESFYDIVTDYNKSLVGFLMLEISRIIMQPKMPDEQWFIVLLTYLKTLAFNSATANIICIKFLLKVLHKTGYEISFDECSVCGLNFVNDVYLDYETGELKCNTCYSSNCVKFSKQQFATLKLINGSELNKLNTIKVADNVLSEIKIILLTNLELRLNHKIKSMQI